MNKEVDERLFQEISDRVQRTRNKEKRGETQKTGQSHVDQDKWALLAQIAVNF